MGWEVLKAQELWVGVLAGTLRIATPLLLTGVGETATQKSGVINIGIEGAMLTGCLAAFIGTFYSNSIWVGVGFAMLAGAFISLIHAVLSITLCSDQIINGIAINLFAWGLTSLVYTTLFGIQVKFPTVERIPTIDIPLLSDIPIIGEVLFQQSPLFFIGLALIGIGTIIMNRTHLGLIIKSVGENPVAASAAGINVNKVRYATVLFGGLMAGLSGAFLSLGIVGGFTENMTAGKGFIVIAAIIVGRWSLVGVMLASFLFGFASALQLAIQALGIDIPYQFLLMLPYVLTMIVISTVKRGAPASMAKAFRKA